MSAKKVTETARAYKQSNLAAKRDHKYYFRKNLKVNLRDK
jgi:hypothetical protein